jgi:hypothetical protein
MSKDKEHFIVKNTESVVITIPPTTEIPVHNIPIIVSKLLRRVGYNPGGYDFSLDASTDVTTITFYFFVRDTDKVNAFLKELDRKFPNATSFSEYSLLLTFDKLISKQTALSYSIALAKVGDVLLYAALNNEIAVVYSSLNDEEMFFANPGRLIKREINLIRKRPILKSYTTSENSSSHQTPLYISPPYYGAVKRL